MVEVAWDRYPVDIPLNITLGFGETFNGREHMGVDFGQPEGTPIYAPCPFVAIPVHNPDGSFGNAVAGDWEETPWFVLLAHMRDTPLVKPGDRVRGGELIGYVGKTGLATGYHTHWQVSDSREWPRDLARCVDPMSIPLKRPAPTELEIRVANLEALFGGRAAVAKMVEARR